MNRGETDILVKPAEFDGYSTTESAHADPPIEPEIDFASNVEESSKCNINLIVLAANLGTMLFGYEVGAISWVLYTIASIAESDDSQTYYSYVEDSSFMIGLVGSTASLGAALFYPLLAYYGNKMSKKNEMIVAAVLYFIGGLMTSLSSDMNWDSVGGLIVLLIGRLIYGCGIAASIHSIPQYIAEVVPDEVRGQYGASVELTVVTGMVLGFGIGYAFEVEEKEGWTVLFRAAYIIAIIMGLLASVLPHNPVWMIHNDFPKEDILANLRFVYPFATEASVNKLIAKSNEDKQKILEQEERVVEGIARSIRNEKKFIYWSGIYDCLTPQLKVIVNNRLYSRCMQLKVQLHALKVLTGQTAILYYAEFIYKDLYPSHIEELVYGYFINRMVVAFVMIFIADCFGRRTFMLSSTGAMTLCMAVVSLGFAIDSRLTTVIALYLSGVGFQIGLGSLMYVSMNEVVPYSIRSTVNAVANCMLFTIYFIVQFIFPYASEILGYSVVFMIIAALNAYAYYYLYFYLPETKGVDLFLAYKLVDEKFNSAPQCSYCCSDNEKDLDDVADATRQERSSLLHSD